MKVFIINGSPRKLGIELPQFQKAVRESGAVRAITTVLKNGGANIVKTINIWSAWDTNHWKGKVESQIAGMHL